MSRFFISRPIFAAVLSIILTLAGSISVFMLPISQYPNITPPTVQVYALYPGANAQLVLDTVAAPIEQQISGVEKLLYMSSQCTNDGVYNLMLTFDLDADPDMCQVLVQNRVQLALPVIPDIVQKEGVAVLKKSPNIMMIVNLTSAREPLAPFLGPSTVGMMASPLGQGPILAASALFPGRAGSSGQYRYDNIYLSNYATISIRDELLRLPGVGDVTYLGQRDYSMRAWLDPERLATLQLTSTDVVNAVEQQNQQVAAGQVGQQPAPKGQAFQMPMNALGRLITPEQFGDIIIKSSQGGKDSQTATVVRLNKVARLELGAMSYNQTCTLDGEPSVALSVYQLPGSNAIQVAKAVYAKMEELKKKFPEGVQYRIVYDTTPFITESIVEVGKTLRDAIILVAIVVLVFLQNWRATLIPLVAVPVAIIGTFTAMALLGFSLNNLSLFGLVLAIGIVVDDAIVVVENVERWLAQGFPAKEAAAKAMDEVTGPVVAVALVLTAVFVPCAFISGITGQFFRQFALTIAVSTVISAFNSLTLSPALAALLLKPHAEHTRQEALPRLGICLAAALIDAWALPSYVDNLVSLSKVWLMLTGAVVGGAAGWFVAPSINRLLGGFFDLFNRSFTFSTGIYTRGVGLLLRGSLIVLVVYAGLLALTGWSFTAVPTGFIPEQDKGYLLVNVYLPDAASVQRTEQVMARIEKIALGMDGVKHTVSISGQSLVLDANASNFGSMYVMLKPFEDRRAANLHGPEIAAELRKRAADEIEGAQVSVFGAPPVDGLGATAGFKLIIENRGDLPLKELQEVTDEVVKAGNADPGLEDLSTSLRVNTPWIYLDIDRDKVMSQGIEMYDVFNALQVYMGSLYVNNFNQFGRSWQVNVQADGRYRDQLEKVMMYKVRNSKGLMVPLSTLIHVRDVGGPVLLLRYNMYSAAAITGNTKPGVSSGDAISVMDAVTEKELPSAMYPQWTELTYMQIQAGNTAMYVFALAVVLVFLVLAAQYESWGLPLAVILVVPMCLLCSVAGVALAHLDVNIFTQIGFVVLVGLASKNAILIVEFAKQQHELGVDRRQATLEACRLRLRPIMMTSFAFILGVVPLVIAEGAGAEMRHALGTAVFSGMLGVTLFGIFLTPVFFYVIEWLLERRHTTPAEPAVPPEPHA